MDNRFSDAKIVRYPAFSGVSRKPYVASIGNFDGLHLGHQAVLAKVVQSARKYETVSKTKHGTALISFYPHPISVVGGGVAPPARITTLHQQLELLGQIGIDILVMLHFTPDLAAVTPRDFLGNLIVGKLNVTHLVVGEDARIGKAKAGTPEVILREMETLGRSAEIVSLLSDNTLKIGSRSIRELITEGDFEKVERYLGRPYRLDGRVVRGAGRGRIIGFPTANVVVGNQAMPAAGVYAVRVIFRDGKRRGGVSNIGFRPTFETGGEKKIEVHIFDFSEDLYGAKLEVELVTKIRPEMKFTTSDELVAQIRADALKARELLHGS